MSDEEPTIPGAQAVWLNLAGTAVFLIALAVAIPFRNHRFAQFLIAGVSMALFAIAKRQLHFGLQIKLRETWAVIVSSMPFFISGLSSNITNKA